MLDDLSTGVRRNVPLGARFLLRDLHDGSDLASVMRSERVDVVSHHAAQIDVRKSLRDPTEDARINVLGSIALFDACRRAGVRRVIFASSGGAVYGDARRIPTPESEPAEPLSPYGCAKRSAELYLEAHRRNGDLDPVIFRYANVYGPRQGRSGEAGVVPIFLRALLAGAPPTIYGDGGQTRDFVYVGDIVAAHRAAIEDLPSGTYNVGTGCETSIAELYARATRITGAWRPPTRIAAAAGEIRRSALDAARLAAAGVRPATRLEEGLALTLDWLRAETPAPALLAAAV